MSQQGDAPPDPNRRQFLKMLGGPVAIGGILAAGGLSASGGPNQALTDNLYVKLKPTTAQVAAALQTIQQPDITSPALKIYPFAYNLAGLDQLVFTDEALSGTGHHPGSSVLKLGLDSGYVPLIEMDMDVADFALPGTIVPGIYVAVSDLNNGVTAQAISFFSWIPPTSAILQAYLTTLFAAYFGTIQIGDQTGSRLNLYCSQFNLLGLGEGGMYYSQFGQGADIGLPTGTGGGANHTACYGDHRHAFTGRFFFDAFLADIALGGATPVIWKRSIIANAITLRRITVDAITPSTGVGNDVIRVGDGTSFLTVNLPSGGATATATGTVNIAAGATLRIDVNGRDTVPAKNVNVTVDYTMNQ